MRITGGLYVEYMPAGVSRRRYGTLVVRRLTPLGHCEVFEIFVRLRRVCNPHEPFSRIGYPVGRIDQKSFLQMCSVLGPFLLVFFSNRRSNTYLSHHKRVVDFRDVNRRVSRLGRPLFHEIGDRDAFSEIESVFGYRRLEGREQLFGLRRAVST